MRSRLNVARAKQLACRATPVGVPQLRKAVASSVWSQRAGVRCHQSGHDSVLYEECYRGWYRTEFATLKMAGNVRAGRVSPATEVLWSNRSIGEQLSLDFAPGSGVPG